MSSKKLYLFFYTLVFFGCANNYDNNKTTIEKLKIEGQPYLKEIIDNGNYNQLLNSIENGNPYLIKHANILYQWSDASTSQSLKYALSRAVIKQPDLVMMLIPSQFTTSEICTIPYIEESIQVELNHINQSLSSLQKSNKETQAHIDCINIYKKIKNNIAKNHSS